MRTRLSALAVLMFFGVVLVLTVAGDDTRKPPTLKPPDRVKPGTFVVPPFGTIKGTITLAPYPGKPASNGNLLVTVSKKLPVKPGGGLFQPQWEELNATKIPVKMGQNDKGPWSYKFTSVPANVSLGVFVRFDGKWSVPTGGGPIRGGKEDIVLKPLEEKTVDLVLKAVIIH
jgi:hypothetical protein